MVAMSVDRPVCEQHVGTLGVDQIPKLAIMRRIHHRVPIALAREQSARLQNLASPFGLGHPHIGGRIGR